MRKKKSKPTPKYTKPAFMKLWPEFGEFCGFGRDTTYNLAVRGEIPAIKVGGSWRVPRAAGEQYARTGINPLRDEKQRAVG